MARHAAYNASGSGRRPAPVSLPVRRPTAGSMTWAPRARNVATLDCVAGCSHISVCMAGANSTGQRAVSRAAVSRSSARPWAARASRSAVAGATTTRSACWPNRTCGTDGTSAKTPVRTGCPDSASKVAAPTNSSAAGVGRTRTECPVSVSRRSSSALLYAAMPPATPSRTFGRWTGSGAVIDDAPVLVGALVTLGVLEEARLDLAHGDGQRLLPRARLHQRTDVLQQALAELGVVVVDLAGALGRVDDQRVLRAHLAEEVVDRRVGDALGDVSGDDTGQRHAHVADSWGEGREAPATAGPTSNSTNFAATACTSSLTSATSNSERAASSSVAVCSRRANCASFSVPRLRSRRSSSPSDGGSTKTATESGTA